MEAPVEAVVPSPAAILSIITMISFEGSLAFRCGLMLVSTRPSWIVFLFALRRSRLSGSSRPNLAENQRRVFQMPWSLCGVISWSLKVLSRERMSPSFQGMTLKPSFWIFSKRRQWMRRVRNLVSPSRSRYSWWTFSPWTALRCGMSLAKGRRSPMILSAQRSRRWSSNFLWVPPPSE